MKHYMPTRIFSGKHVLFDHKDVFKKAGDRCLIITSPHAGRVSGALDDLETILKEEGITYTVFDQIRENPSVASCIEAGRKANETDAAFIIGVGGGSVLDAAKTAAVVANDPELTEEDIYALKWQHEPRPLFLVGTTAGTGSEVTYVSVMTDKNGRKRSIHHDDLYALYSFGDPDYTRSMKENVRISTAIDALAHLMESYFNNNANDISRAYALEGVRLLYPELKKLTEKVQLNDEDLETVYNASILGGLAINITGTVFCHTLGYYFTEHYHLPHGFACALFTNDLIDYELENQPEYAKAFFDILKIDPQQMKRLVSDLLPDFDIHMSEEEIEAILPRYQNNKSVKNTYGKMEIEDIKKVLYRLH
ncbi:MAG: iron-containing alcohol dehydrogenase [Erysipelotrichaceae bacterium]|nr:iron-containing alcohol dehydrogenase [Erysipelotrichaceae bacterium]